MVRLDLATEIVEAARPLIEETAEREATQAEKHTLHRYRTE